MHGVSAEAATSAPSHCLLPDPPALPPGCVSHFSLQVCPLPPRHSPPLEEGAVPRAQGREHVLSAPRGPCDASASPQGSGVTPRDSAPPPSPDCAAGCCAHVLPTEPGPGPGDRGWGSTLLLLSARTAPPSHPLLSCCVAKPRLRWHGQQSTRCRRLADKHLVCTPGQVRCRRRQVVNSACVCGLAPGNLCEGRGCTGPRHCADPSS